jgi:hypothetical protein
MNTAAATRRIAAATKSVTTVRIIASAQRKR